ncbi:MAG: hypothetical protein WC998_01900 [Candidatus Paceibacterota bacterium]|jgi:hypothetical protein
MNLEIPAEENLPGDTNIPEIKPEATTSNNMVEKETTPERATENIRRIQEIIAELNANIAEYKDNNKDVKADYLEKNMQHIIDIYTLSAEKKIKEVLSQPN